MARRRRGQFPKPKKENGQWKIRYWTDQAQEDGSIRRVRKTKCLGRVGQMTFTEARKEAQRFLEPINDVSPETAYSERTMKQLVENWQATVKPNYRLSTQLQYESLFGKWVLPALGNLPVSEVERTDVQSLLTHAGQKLAYESVKGLRKVIRHVFSVAEDWGWIPPGSNPAKGKLKLPPRIRKRPPRIHKPTQVRMLVTALPEPHATVVLVAVFAGLRKGELEALRRNDLVEEGLVVDEAIYQRQLGPPKTPKSNGVVPLGPRTRRAIENWLAISKFKDPDDFMFATKAGKPIDLHNSIRRVVKPCCRRLGIPEASWHDLRYTFTTWGRQNAADIPAEVMRDLLRHTDVKMTLDVYSQISNGSEAIVRIEEYAWSEDAAEVM